MKNFKDKRKKIIIGIVLIVALMGICIGAIKVWDAFKNFEKSMITEKDTQIRKRIKLEDANIQMMIENFTREAKAFNNKALMTNSIYAGTVVYDDGKYSKKLSNHDNCDFKEFSDIKDFMLCEDKEELIYMAYKVKKEKLIYYQLISLENLLNDVIGTEQDSEEMNFLMDADRKIVVYKEGEIIQTITDNNYEEEYIIKYANFIRECETNSKSSAKSFKINNENNEEYTSRMVVSIASKTDNKLFAIGKTSNYDATIKPSMLAANKILIYGGLTIIGVAIIVFLLIFIQRSAVTEIKSVRRRNEILEEINQKMQALAHHQRLETIGTMTAGIAHDFNNLLTPIMGYSMMTMEMLPKEEEALQENLLEIYNASNRAKDIVERLAELSKKGDAATFTDIDINDLIENIIGVSAPVKPENVEVVTHLESPGAFIKGDRTQLSQLILNFTLNAYDALSVAGGTYMISTSCEQDKVAVQFIDNGPGMDADTVSKIFDPFFTTKESGKGTGLGLAIIAQIAETHNAKIYVDSELGKGTGFRVVFSVSN